jgi:hypothetical protein
MCDALGGCARFRPSQLLPPFALGEVAARERGGPGQRGGEDGCPVSPPLAVVRQNQVGMRGT